MHMVDNSDTGQTWYS